MSTNLYQMLSWPSKAGGRFLPFASNCAPRLERPENLLPNIRRIADDFQQLPEAGLLEQSASLRKAISADKDPTCSTILPRVFALTTEALRRHHGVNYYDVQLLGGLALAQGAIAEMQTGEGKTFVVALPAVLYGLMGRGVHVATTNHYLAARDHESLEPVFSMLGLSSALLPEDSDEQQTIAAYESDITYGTGYQFGFDYLRDQIAIRNQIGRGVGQQILATLRQEKLRSLGGQRQRKHAFAIIDEVDSVMLDEANTPLLLSGPSEETAVDDRAYRVAKVLVDQLEEGIDIFVDSINQAVQLTAEGQAKALAAYSQSIDLQIVRPWISYVYNALRAKHIFKADEHYVVQEDKVCIVDVNTGRIHPDRTWRAGLHQAVETKEGLELTPASETQATITRQRYFGFYDRIAGLTGTATESREEFLNTYGLKISVIPRNLPSKRNELPTRFFASIESKLLALAAETDRIHATGAPVLIGTRTIESTNQIAQALESQSLEFVVLNGVQDEEEASIVARAGELGAITIATNIAGRGTDIPLTDQTKALGGLHVLCAEHHHSIRIDRQLIGRSARKGDPGASQFFASAEDEIFIRHAPALAARIRKLADANGECRVPLDQAVRQLQIRLEAEGHRMRRRAFLSDKQKQSVLDAAFKRG